MITVPNSTVLGLKKKSALMAPDHKREYAPHEMRVLLSKYFRVKRIEGVAFPEFIRYPCLYWIQRIPGVYTAMNTFTFVIPEFGTWLLAIAEKV